MNYLEICKNVIDVTKAPYYADNTGNTDCTQALCQVFDDLLIREIEGIEQTHEKLKKMMKEKGKEPVYIGFENRIACGWTNVIFPEYVPSAKIIYFPAGTYLISDTITYSFNNLKNIFESAPFAELCRGIHILGESKENVVIQLADQAKGFEKGSKKPVISLNNADECCKRERTNVAQMNTIENLTIDCGKENAGAVGIRFSASNSGRVENVTFKAEEGHAALQIAVGAEGSFINLNAEGFDYGVDTEDTSICVFEAANFSKCKNAGFLTGTARSVLNDVKTAPIPLFCFKESTIGTYYVRECDMDIQTDTKGNLVYVESKREDRKGMKIHANQKCKDARDCACVDDFGAKGDGKTDATEAIQRAMNSGKSIILFGEGHYLVNGEIKIPASVKTIDFMFCDLFAGERLRETKNGALFSIEESSEDILYMENLYTFEQFYGYMRLIKHASVRDLFLSDIHTQTASMYFNTVPGSKVYLDNCACTTGTYSLDTILVREGKKPEYCGVIPFEFHGQEVYGRQINPERADIELLNDGSKVYIDGYKVEGPGTAVKTINGGSTQINVFSAGIGNSEAENALFETIDSSLEVNLGREGGFDISSMYQIIFEENNQGMIKRIMESELERVEKFRGRIHHYKSGNV